MGKIKNIIMPVLGMSCSNCALNIESALKKVKGIDSAYVDFAGEKLNVSFDTEIINESGIIEKVKERGYRIAVGKLEFEIAGLQDNSDAVLIEKVIQKKEGVIDCRVNLSTETVIIKYIPGSVSISELTEGIKSTGFDFNVPLGEGDSSLS